MKFKRDITIQPAYDCIRVQPCVHGSKKCGTYPGASHGVHYAEMHMNLSGKNAEVILAVNTGWYLPQTPHDCHHKTDRMGFQIEYHSNFPQYEDQYIAYQDPEKCPKHWDTCYVGTVFSVADEGALQLVTGGTDAAWKWLEELWHEVFGGVR